MLMLPLLLIPLGVGAALTSIGQPRDMSDNAYVATIQTDSIVQDTTSTKDGKEPYGSIMNPSIFRSDSTIIPEDSVAL